MQKCGDEKGKLNFVLSAGEMIDEGRGKAEDNSWKATSSDKTLQAPFISHVPARQKVDV